MTVIIGIKTNNRFDTAAKIQKILTDYGCFIKTRLGLHDVSKGVCPKFGLILLEVPDREKSISIERLLLDIAEVEIQRMEFDFNT